VEMQPGNIHPAWPVVSLKTDFVPCGPWNTDGLIVFAPLLDDNRSQYIQQVMAEGHPVLFIGTGENGPSVAVDNESGINQAIEHLVNHGHKQIAFIAGDPIDKGDSKYRLSAYHKAMSDYGLEVNPALIAYGGHKTLGGHTALRELLNSDIEFSAVLASDDSSAIGAMRAIYEAGKLIPKDMAIIGFDDQPDAVAQVPPLTSIHVPLANMGNQALELMLDHIEGSAPLDSIWVSTQLVPRQSCGCLPGTVLSAAEFGSQLHINRVKSSKIRARSNNKVIQRIGDEMVAALAAEAQPTDLTVLHHFCTRIIETFIESLVKSNPNNFQTTLMECLQDMELISYNLHSLQEIISILRRRMARLPVNWSDPETIQLAEGLLHLARVAISESTQRVIDRHIFRQDAVSYRLSVLTARLSAILDERHVVNILAEHLPDVGIRNCRVALFEPQADDPVKWSVVIGSNADLEPTSQRFLSRQFPPLGLYPSDEVLCLALLPLVHQEEALGYVALDAIDLEACATIARQLSVTLKIARLHNQVVELSLTDSLTGLYNRRYFELFLTNEVERSWRYMRGLAVIMLDLDRFKEYNDTFGHPAGDKALQLVAQCLRKGCRKTDVVARYGGDEFAIILPEADIKGAMKVAEKTRSSVADLSGLKQPLTVSVGISILHQAEYGAEMLLKQADQALYEAKRTGRDLVYVFQG